MNKCFKITTIDNVKHIRDTLFGKFFYSDSLFSMDHYKNKVHNISFEWHTGWKKYEYFYSIIRTPLQTEMVTMTKDKKIVWYRKETRLY